MHSSWLIDRLAESAHAVFPDDVPGWAYTDCLFFYHGTGLHATGDDDQPFDAAFNVPALAIGAGAAIHVVRTERFEENCAWLDSIGQGPLAASLREHARNLPPLLNQAIEAVATIRADAIYAANQRACEYLDVGHPARHRELIEWAVLLSGRTNTGGPIGGGRPRQVALAKALTRYPLRPGAKAPSDPTDADHAAGAIWMIVEEANNRIIRTRVEARKAIRQVCAALGVAFDVEVRELMKRNSPNGDTSMPQGHWYVVRDSDSTAVCACAEQSHAQSVCDAMGAGFTAKRAAGGEWLRWDREIAVADSQVAEADYVFSTSDLDGYSNDDVEEFQIRQYPKHADRVRAARYLSILLEAVNNEPVAVPVDSPTPATLASRFRDLGERLVRLRTSTTSDDAANAEIAEIQELGGRLCCAGGKSGALDYGDLTPNTRNWQPPFDPKNPRHALQLREVYQSIWNDALMIEAKRNPTDLPGGETVGGGIYELHGYDPDDPDGPMGITHWPADRWRQYAEACVALCRLLAERCDSQNATANTPSPAPAAAIDPARIERLEAVLPADIGEIERLAERVLAKAVEALQTREPVPAVKLPILKPWAMDAWQANQVRPKPTETQIAKMLARKYNDPKITQPRVSEQIKRAQVHAEASGLASVAGMVLPQYKGRAPARTLDPAAAEQGKRTDGRASHLRERERQKAKDGDDED